jgi:polyisoprenoid-binding protein YceI
MVISDSLTPVPRYGPDTGKLEVHTYREGVAAKVGHDLVIEVTKWAASDDGGMLELTADPTSLVVREGNRGVKPLTDRDRASIHKTIQKEILGTQEITFSSRSVEGGGVKGDLTIAGRTQPVEFDLHREGDRVRAKIPVVQTRWGIKPYRGFMGALKVRDDVEVVLDAAGVG